MRPDHSRGKWRCRPRGVARLQMDDVLEAARNQQGIERAMDIRFAILEVSGNISIIKKEEKD
jgi:uncharacterized membrane protein YcaP (DUF421 family)